MAVEFARPALLQLQPPAGSLGFPFSACGWARRDPTVTDFDFYCVFYLGNLSGGMWAGVFHEAADDDFIDLGMGQIAESPTPFAGADWYFWAFTVASGAGNSMLAWRLENEETLGVDTATWSGTHSVARLRVGGFGGGTDFSWPGDMAYVRLFEDGLSVPELLAESASDEAVHGSCVMDLPMVTGATVAVDISGTGNDPTPMPGTGGSFTTVADPVIALPAPSRTAGPAWTGPVTAGPVARSGQGARTAGPAWTDTATVGDVDRQAVGGRAADAAHAAPVHTLPPARTGGAGTRTAGPSWAGPVAAGPVARSEDVTAGPSWTGPVAVGPVERAAAGQRAAGPAWAAPAAAGEVARHAAGARTTGPAHLAAVDAGPVTRTGTGTRGTGPAWTGPVAASASRTGTGSRSAGPSWTDAAVSGPVTRAASGARQAVASWVGRIRASARHDGPPPPVDITVRVDPTEGPPITVDATEIDPPSGGIAA